MGMPQVRFLKYFRSLGKCQGNWLSLPITLFSAAATRSDKTIRCRNLGFEIWDLGFETSFLNPVIPFGFRISLFVFCIYTATGALIAG
jgi:hypothetical protein